MCSVYMLLYTRDCKYLEYCIGSLQILSVPDDNICLHVKVGRKALR